jgi:hypothetical protein
MQMSTKTTDAVANATIGDRAFFTEIELADRWNLSVKALQSWRLKGDGPRFRKFGNRVRYALADVREFEDASVRDSTSSANPNQG